MRVRVEYGRATARGCVAFRAALRANGVRDGCFFIAVPQYTSHARSVLHPTRGRIVHEASIRGRRRLRSLVRALARLQPIAAEGRRPPLDAPSVVHRPDAALAAARRQRGILARERLRHGAHRGRAIRDPGARPRHPPARHRHLFSAQNVECPSGVVQRDLPRAAHSNDVRGSAHAFVVGRIMMVQRFMEGAAIVLGAAALALIFAPEHALASFDIAPMPPASTLAQLYGAALFGLATTAWFARTMLLGGIYGKAVAVSYTH